MAVVGIAAVVFVSRPSDRRAATAGRSGLRVAELLAAPAAGFALAETPRALRFPGDHGPHPEYRTEWWYVTGNLSTESGQDFGYQLTFFRMALVARPPARESAWATRDAWMAHFALTDVAGRRFHAVSRLARGALGLSGATGTPFHVWVEDWDARGTDDVAGSGMHVRARDGDIAIDLTLSPVKPPVAHGDRGLSRKGAGSGNASYYYSLSRLATRGEVADGRRRVPVTGASWMDREWSTSALERGQVGWDWFAFQLDDGRDLMFYRLRRDDGSTDPFSGGTLVARDGSSEPLAAPDVAVEVVDWWTSAATNTRYPARWRLAIPRAGLTVDVVPRLAAQEWTTPVRYWEGAVAVAGTAAGQPITGAGYVELVGYEPAALSPGRERGH